MEEQSTSIYIWHSPPSLFHFMSLLHSHLPVPWMVRFVLHTRFMSMAMQVLLSVQVLKGSNDEGLGGSVLADHASTHLPYFLTVPALHSQNPHSQWELSPQPKRHTFF